MKLQQKLLAVLMVVIMLASMVVPMTVSAAEPAENGISIRFEANTTPIVGGTIKVSVYFTGKNIKSLMPTPEYDESVLKPSRGRWAIDGDAMVGDEYLCDMAPVQEAWQIADGKAPVITFSKGVDLEDVKLLELTFDVLSDTFAPGVNNLVSFGEVRYALMPVGGEETTYNNISNPELVTLTPYVVTVSCDHEYAIDRYNGLMTCSECDEVCAHENWTNSVCDSCGLACTHDWSYSGNVATCGVCGKTCASHAKKGLFLDCATCGYDMALANSYYEGNSMITDTDNTLETAHGFKMNLQLTVGSDGTVYNTKDTSRNDNIYYSATETAGTGSDYYSLVTWVFAKTGESTVYRSLFSLWIDPTAEFSSRVNGEAPEGFVEPKLWLTVANNSNLKVCALEAGETYDFTMFYDVANGWCVLEVRLDGELVGECTLDASDFAGTLTSSKIRLGETYTAKRLHVQKISFEDVIFSDTYENGACRVCGASCEHRYNIGGYCADCGVLGDPINYSDYAGECKLTASSGVFKQGGGAGFWQYFDDTGVLLGRDYVYEMDVKFTSVDHNSSYSNGVNRFLMWSDVNAASTTGGLKFGLFLCGFDGNTEDLMLGFKDGFKDTDKHVDLNLNQLYNIRIAIRSTPTATEGKYDNAAEVYIDGVLVHTATFQLTAADGMAIRLGDHVSRITRAKYEVNSNFGVRFLDSTPEYIGAQEKENADYSSDEKFDIRFLFGFDDLYLEDVGVKVEASVSDGTSGEKILSAGSKALKAVSVGGVTKQVGVNGVGYGGYYMAAAITDIDLDLDSVYTFVLTPYIEKQYATELTYMPYSYEITVSFDDNAKMVIDYKKIG